MKPTLKKILAVALLVVAAAAPRAAEPSLDMEWEAFLTMVWVASAMPPAETGAEMDYRTKAILTLVVELRGAGFRVKGPERRSVERKLDKLLELEELDGPAAMEYLRRLLNGETEER